MFFYNYYIEKYLFFMHFNLFSTDFARLNPGSLILNGSYMFENKVAARAMHVNGAINGLKLDDFVLTSNEQDIHNLKIFKEVSADNIGTSLLGEVTSIIM